MRGDSATRQEPSDYDPDRVRERLIESAEAIRLAALEEALAKLEAEDGMTEEQREVVSELATAIARGTIAAPESAVARADDPETIRAVVRLYGLDAER